MAELRFEAPQLGLQPLALIPHTQGSEVRASARGASDGLGCQAENWARALQPLLCWVGPSFFTQLQDQGYGGPRTPALPRAACNGEGLPPRPMWSPQNAFWFSQHFLQSSF